MAKKTEKKVIALFEDNVKKENKNGNIKSNSKSSNKSNTVISSTKISSTSRKTNDKIRKVDDDNAKINAKSKSKRSEDGKKYKKSRTESKKQPITNKPTNKNNEIKTSKVGRKTAKNNWWEGCDYVWVDGIDHWVSKTAFRNDGNDKPVYTLNNYVQGLDSYWCLRYKPDNKYITESDKALMTANNELKKKYKTWKEISELPKLSEAFITKYKDYLSWLTIFKVAEQYNRTFSDEFKKKHNNKFKILHLIK